LIINKANLSKKQLVAIHSKYFNRNGTIKHLNIKTHKIEKMHNPEVHKFGKNKLLIRGKSLKGVKMAKIISHPAYTN